MQDIVSDFSQVKFPSSAKFISFNRSTNSANVLVKFSQKIYNQGQTPRDNQHEVLYTTHGKEIVSTKLPVHTSENIFKCIHGPLMAIGTTKQNDIFLQIYREGELIFDKQVDNLHGKFCTDGINSSFNYNCLEIFGNHFFDQNHFVYQAEAKEDASSEFHHSKFNYCPSWGEQMDGLRDPRVFIINFDDHLINEVKVPLDLSPSNPILFDGNVFYIGWWRGRDEECKFGIKFCNNRPSSIVKHDLSSMKDEIIVAVEERKSHRSLFLNQKSIYVLQSAIGNSHYSGCDLIRLGEKEGKGPVCLVSNIFTMNVFSSANIIAFNTYDKTQSVLSWYKLDSEGNVTGEGVLRGKHCFDMLGEQLLLKDCADPCAPSNLYLYNLHSEESLPLYSPQKHFDASVSINQMSTTSESIHISKSNEPSSKLIILIHGGPNSVFTLAYSLFVSVLVGSGYDVVAVNYRGSIGYGCKGIKELEGQIGKYDLDDCMSVYNKYSQEYRKIFLFGGSHGGYIASFLTAKYPNSFSGCVLRNPVVDLYSMSLSSDIGDWSYGQLGIEYDLLKPSSGDKSQVDLLRERSPLTFAKNVECPTLILIGEKDLRVSPYQGKSWYRELKSNGVKCKLLSFPDANHSLSTPFSDSSSMRSTLEFLSENSKV